MATAIGTWCPTPTSLTLIRPQSDAYSDADPPTFAEAIQTINSAPEPEIDDSTRFRPLRLFATGGQGLVYVAHDRQLGREVALKELKPRNSDRKITRHRFIREAEITGSLEHPGVVPVYALGRHADGRPYYAMRLIQGRTLHDAVQHYYTADLKVTDVERNLLFRKLLQRFVSVCQTVAYAHSRGIIHRDLKPANVLLGQYGEALVADWGLARPFHPTEGCGLDSDVTMEPDPGDSPSNATLMGSALGTPAYMSPEQSEGRWDKVGPTSDVYSLGATLFTILTGQSPMPKLPWPEAHRRIMTGDIPSPSQINPKAARGLVAICRKAMALKPTDRYSSALALSEDIEHWLADEPVTAEPEPFSERAGRWIRRHRTMVWAIGVLWITAGIALGVGLVMENGWRVTNEKAHHITRTVLDRTQSRIVDEWLGTQRELLPEHKLFLENLLRDYEMLAAQTGSDPETQLAVVRAYRRVGEIRQRLGEQVASGKALAEAESRVLRLNDSKEARTELARLRAAQGSLERSGKRLEVAESQFAEALMLFQEIAKSNSADDSIKRELAAAYNNHAAALSQLNRRAKAITGFQAALVLRQQLAADKQDDNDSTKELASGYAHLGECQRQESDWYAKEAKRRMSARENEAASVAADRAQQLIAEAETNLSRAADVTTLLVARSPNYPPYHEEMASAAHKLGRLFDSQERWPEARQWLNIACDYLQRLTARYPSVPDFTIELASTLHALGKIEKKTANHESSLEFFDRAISVLKPLESRESTVHCDFVTKSIKRSRADALAHTGRHLDAAEAWAALATEFAENADEYRPHQALQLLKCGRTTEAIGVVEAIVSNRNAKGEAIYNCACVYALAATLDQTKSNELKTRGIALLRDAAERGFFAKSENIHFLDNDRELDSLRELPEFKEFRDSLSSSNFCYPAAANQLQWRPSFGTD